MNTLTLYFSRSGHTREMAELIHQAAGGDIAEIRTKRTYSRSYGVAILQGGLEKMKGTLPELRPLSVDLSQYDVIYLGTPVWWFSITPAMKSFLSSHDLSGKTLALFTTHGGMPKESMAEFKKLAAPAHVEKSLEISYKGNQRQVTKESVLEWAKR